MHLTMTHIGSLDWRMARTAAAALLALSAWPQVSVASAVTPDTQSAMIEIKGSGIAPNDKVALLSGGKKAAEVKADKNGEFSFSKLKYYSFVPLNFEILLPPSQSDLVTTGQTNMVFAFDPNGSKVRISGKASPAASVVVNVDGVKSANQVAGAGGEFYLQTRTKLGIADGTSSLLASIINVGEACCPRTLVPAAPIQLSVSSIAIPQGAIEPPEANPAIPAAIVPAPRLDDKKTTSPASAPAVPDPNPVVVPQRKEAPKYYVPIPNPDSNDQKPSTPPKKIPYIVTGQGEAGGVIVVDDGNFAISFSSSDYDNTYVGGLKKLSDEFAKSLIARAVMIGAFIDGRAAMAAQRTLQHLNADTRKAYHPSDTICRFGTLSRSLAATEAKATANKLAFSQILLGRNNQSDKTLYSEPIRGMVENYQDFKKKYCESVDNNNGLGSYCTTSTDAYFNRDVDFTRVYDTPLTLDVDFTNAALTKDEERVIALFQSLGLRDPYLDTSGNDLTRPDKGDDVGNRHQAEAVRQLIGNSFASLVSMKAKGTAGSGTYMINILTKLGLSSADATKLISSNPSYFAQMEILTKKVYQDPRFFANLYDSPTNVERQRVAMKAINLMQDRDLLDSLRRREVLLSELLEMKLKERGTKANLESITSD